MDSGFNISIGPGLGLEDISTTSRLESALIQSQQMFSLTMARNQKETEAKEHLSRLRNTGCAEVLKHIMAVDSYINGIADPVAVVS